MALEELQNGRYRHLRLLGSGGMGEVYLMNDTRVSRQVAIKVIRSESAGYPGSDASKDATRLFQREARAIAALEHPNILPLYDFGEEIHSDITMSYMVMPFCPDGSLASWLRQDDGAIKLSPQDIAHLVEQAADALQYAHDHQVIHLDVKPPNFLLRSNRKNPNRPVLLLADFGIARSSATAANSSRTIRGTPTSMAPEQWSSTPVAATDQYALAVMVYELLAGRPPFVGGMEQLMYQHFNAQPLPPSTFNPQVPRSIDEVMLRALAKKPEERFPSISDFASAFEQAARPLPAELALRQQQPIDNNKTNDIRTTLAISEEEARGGASRMITLPGGQAVKVNIPPGAYHGQIIRVQDSGQSTVPVGTLILTLSIAPTIRPAEKARSVSRTFSSEETLLTPPNVQQSPPPLLPLRVSDHDLPTIASSHPNLGTLEKQPPPQSPPPKKRRASLPIIISVISGLIILALLTGTIFVYNNNRQTSANTLAQSQTATAFAQTKLSPTVPATPTPTPLPKGLYIAGTYNGSMTNQTTNEVSSISILLEQKQGVGILSGTFTFRSPSQKSYPLTGKDDLQGNFSFTVQQDAGQQPLVFYGKFQSDILKGNFCNSNTNSCSVSTGYFTVGPRF
jgi:serine/threonine protein kinase